MFASDESARKHGYTVIGLGEIVAHLEAQQVESEIFRDYLLRARRLLGERETALATLRTPTGYTELGRDYVQYTFLQQLAARCPDTIGEGAIHRGRSIGGAPWTHFRFAQFDGVYPDHPIESLFHRVDRRKDDDGEMRFYLSTRQWANVKDSEAAREIKRKRLAQYRELFAAALAQAGTTLRYSKPTSDYKGANESEIATVFFKEGNTVQSVLEQVPGVHASFVAGLRSTIGRVSTAT